MSYDGNHNQDNGEDNRDGTNDNASWNCGAEGETSDPWVLGLRARQARNHLALLLLSRGVPMLLAGDEVLRSQGGNNNAWCQDNPVSWFDWGLLDANRELRRFTKELIGLRRRHPCLTINRFFDGRPIPGRGIPDIAWYGTGLEEPPWRDGSARFLRFTVVGLSDDEEDLHVILNMSDQAVEVPLPSIPGRRWHLALDTSQPSPADIAARDQQEPHPAITISANPRSVVALEARD